MKRKFLLFMMLAATIMIFGGCTAWNNQVIIQASGPVVSRSFVPGDFAVFSTGGVNTVVFRQSESKSITIEMNENMFDYLEIDLNQDILYVGFVSGTGFNFANGVRPTIYVYAPYLEGLNLSGTAGTKDWDKIIAQNFFIDKSGTGNVEIALEVDILSVDASGTGNIELSGSANDVDIDMSGTGRIYAENLQTFNTLINISGTARAYVSASDNLNVTAAGTSRVRYFGNPSVTQNTSGTASVLRAD